MLIELRSDTFTKPTKSMLEAMFNAQVGDDVFEEDPTVSALEAKTAAMFGKEAGLFCPSGTMTNQIAIRIHTQPGHEVICDKTSHIYYYEGGGIAYNSLSSVRLLNGDRGRIAASDVLDNINPDNIHHPITSLVSLENTCNKGGGSYYALSQIAEISATCKLHKLTLHLDGARIFNALEETHDSPSSLGNYFDTISICLSKGLGAPVGSVLVGTKEHIRKARRVRKVWGGGMRQAGFLAAAGIYALDNHITRLKEDHTRAKAIGNVLKTLPEVEDLLPVESNIVVFRLANEKVFEQFQQKLATNDVKAAVFGKNTLRMVTHLNFEDTQLEQLLKVLKM